MKKLAVLVFFCSVVQAQVTSVVSTRTLIGNSKSASATPTEIGFDAIKSATEFGFANGANNDAAWAAFYAYVNSLSGGNCYRVKLEFPPGIFYSDTVRIPNNNLNCVGPSLYIEGAGQDSTIFTPKVSRNQIFWEIASDTGPTLGIILKDFRIIGIGSSNPDQHGIRFGSQPQLGSPYHGGVWSTELENVNISNFDGIQTIFKADSVGYLVPNQNAILFNFGGGRNAASVWPSMIMWGQVGQFNWVQGDVSSGGGQGSSIGPNLWIAADPRRGVSVTGVAAASPAVWSLGNNSGYYYNGQSVQIVGSSLPAGFTTGRRYYICNEVTGAGTQTVDLCSLKANAVSGTAVAATTTGTAGNFWLVPWEMTPSAAVNTTTGTITTNWAHILTGGDSVQLFGTGLPAGFSTGTTYYVNVLSDTTLSLSTSFANTQGTPAVVKPNTGGTTGSWGIAPAGGGSPPYTILMEGITSQNAEWAYAVDGADTTTFIEPHLENDNNGFRYRNGAIGTIVGGHYANVGSGGSQTLFETANYGNTLSIFGSVYIIGTTNRLITNLGTSGGQITWQGQVPNGFPPTTGSGVTPPWGAWMDGQLGNASTINIGLSTAFIINSGSSPIAYIQSQLVAGATVTMRVWPSSGNTVNFVNTGNIYLGGNTSEYFPIGSVVTFRLMDGFVDTWELINVTMPAQRLAASGATPTISGFGTRASVTQSNGPSSFSINVGTGSSASTGTIALPAAPHAWACSMNDVTTPARNNTVQTSAASTTTVGVTNYVRTTGVAGAWTASDILQVSCQPN